MYAKLHTTSRVYVGAMLPVLFFGCEAWLVDTDWPCSNRLRTAFAASIGASPRRPHHCYRAVAQNTPAANRELLRWLGNIARMPASRIPRLVLAAVPDATGASPDGQQDAHAPPIATALKRPSNGPHPTTGATPPKMPQNGIGALLLESKHDEELLT